MGRLLRLLLVVSSAALASGLQSQTSSETSSFDEYVSAFKRGYHQGSDEYSMRSMLFQRRVEEVRTQNSKPDRLWTAGVNDLTDRTDAELRQLRGWRHSGGHPRPQQPSLLAERVEKVQALPAEIHWKNTTSAKSVADQGSCGSCWAVATAALLQAHYEIHMGNARSFSAQELVDCVPNPKQCGGSGGCSGATVELAMKYVQANGLSTTSEVPYYGEDQACKSSAASLASRADDSGSDGAASGLLGLQSWTTLPSNKAEPLMRALQAGPVAISASADGWSSYYSGIFDSCPKDAIIDHAILLVGYGSEWHVNYWTVQNSWSKLWGENGFIRIKRHATTDDDDAYCGTDSRPGDGIACKPYPDEVTVCGMCGLLYDSVAPKFGKAAVSQVEVGGANGKRSRLGGFFLRG